MATTTPIKIANPVPATTVTAARNIITKIINKIIVIAINKLIIVNYPYLQSG